MIQIKDEVREGNRKGTRDAKSLGIFSEDQLVGYGDDISFLLGTNVTSAKHSKRRKYNEHESYGHNDTTKELLRL